MLKFLLGLVLTVVGIPVLLLFALLDFTPDIPVEDYSNTAIPLIVEEEINSALTDLDAGVAHITLTESAINNIIYNAIVNDTAPDYNPGEGCTDTACEYIIFEEIEADTEAYFGVTGIWTKLYDDIISLNVAVKGHYYTDFTTRIRMEFQVIDNSDSFEISYHKLQVGHVPLPKFIINPIVNAIVDAQGLNTDSVNNEFLTVDTSTLTVSLDKHELANQFETSPAAKFAVGLIFDEELLQFRVVDGEDPHLELFADINKLQTEVYETPEHGLLSTEEVMLGIGADILTSTLTEENPSITITEEDFNQLLYELMPVFEMSDFDDSLSEFQVGIEHAYVEFATDESFVFVLPIYVGDSYVVVRLIASYVENPDKLSFQFEQVTIGQDPGETVDEYVSVSYEEMKAVLGNFSVNNEFMQFDSTYGTLYIPTAAFESLLNGAIKVTGYEYSSEGIVILFEPNLSF